MLEMIILLSVSLGVYLLWSKGLCLPQAAKQENVAGQLASQTTTSGLHNLFLAQLQNEIESTLFPRPTDSVLQRHYDTMVAVELRNRLAELTS